MLRILIIIIITIFMGCGNKENNNKPDNLFHTGDKTIKIVNEYLQEDSALSSVLFNNNISLTDAIDIAVVPKDSALFILNWQGDIVKINSRGEFLFSIQPQGQGPGELMRATEIKVRGEILYIADLDQNKIATYTLDGIPVYDILFTDLKLHTFEFYENGEIVLPNPVKEIHGGKMFHVYDKKGNKVRSFGDNSILHRGRDLYETPPDFRLNKTPVGNLVFTIIVTGEFYLFDGKSGEFLKKFSIQNGPEWEESMAMQEIAAQSKFGAGFPLRVENVNVDSEGNVIITWGNEFRGEETIAMIFDSTGTFKGRVFADTQGLIPFTPTIMKLENDSTAWFYSRERYVLARARLVPFVKN